MPDKLTPAKRHTCMSRIRSKNTKPEVRLRKGLFALGYRYRVNVKGLAGSPDIVLPRYRTCIFINAILFKNHKLSHDVRQLMCIFGNKLISTNKIYQHNISWLIKQN